MTVIAFSSCVLLLVGMFVWEQVAGKRAASAKAPGCFAPGPDVVAPPPATEAIIGPPDGQGFHIIARVVESIEDADSDEAQLYRDPWADRGALVREVGGLLPTLERLATTADADDAAALLRARDMLMEYANGVGGGGLISMSAHAAEIQSIWKMLKIGCYADDAGSTPSAERRRHAPR